MPTPFGEDRPATTLVVRNQLPVEPFVPYPPPPQPVDPPGLTVLVDDVRSFRDGRPCRVARSSGAAVALLQELRGERVEHLWLDHDLRGDDTVWPVVRHLEDAAASGRPLDVGLVHVHAAGAGPAHRIGVSLRRAGYQTERSVALGLWTW